MAYGIEIEYCGRCRKITNHVCEDRDRTIFHNSSRIEVLHTSTCELCHQVTMEIKNEIYEDN